VKLGYNELGYNELGYNERLVKINKIFSPKWPFYSTKQTPGYNEQIWLVPICSLSSFSVSLFYNNIHNILVNGFVWL